jgi:hypothetical protein
LLRGRKIILKDEKVRQDNEGAKMSDRKEVSDAQIKLEKGVDYYLENGLLVFTSAFLLKRGYCCESGCRHCPYKEAT